MPNEPEPRRTRTGSALERLYVLWAVSLALTLLLILLAVSVLRSHLVRQADALREHTAALAALHERLAALESMLAHEPIVVSPGVLRPEPPASPPTTRPSQPSPPTATTTRPLVGAAADAESELAQALRIDDDGNAIVADRELAARLVSRAASAPSASAYSGRTWARLAWLAQLLGRDEQADAFAERSRESGVVPREYYAADARKRLESGDAPAALVAAQRLAGADAGDPLGRLWTARAQLALGRAVEASEAIAGIDARRLPPADRLRLCRLYAELEQWEALDRTLDTFRTVSKELRAERNLLRAIGMIHAERLTEALAILEGLLETRPEDEELRAWQAAALVRAGQFAAARDALGRVPTPTRADTWYWLGATALSAGQEQEAVRCFQRSLSVTRGFAPAWEGLATIALNNSDLEAAVQYARSAVEANPLRASANLLLAIASARSVLKVETVSALRRALELDPKLADVARQVEAIRALLGPGELEALLPRPAASQPGSAPADP
ncbi:MAG: tetratricopeptide repeat protein [Phycisphaerae bacterium]|jgi:tetratricopeptide (TPR) repeat protein